MNFTIRSQSLRLFRCCILLVGILVFCSPADHPQTLQSPPNLPGAPSQSTISVKTELVVLPVSVTDANGSFVSGLSPQDFRVYEDGRLQKVLLFQQGDTPVTVGLIVDHSRSMGPKLAEVAAAVSAFARSSNPQDEMFVVDFNDDVSVELLGREAFHERREGTRKSCRSCLSTRDKPRFMTPWLKGSSICSSAIATGRR